MRTFSHVLLLANLAIASAFAPSFSSIHNSPSLLSTPATLAPTTSARYSSSSSSNDENSESANDDVASLKNELLQKIATLKQYQDEDGKIKVDFGVKGGELDKKSRAPVKLDFYSVSERVGKTADSIFESVQKLSKVNPTSKATEGMGDKTYDASKRPPLDGPWNLLFSTAADASFSKDSKRGDAKAGNIVDARAGKMTNVIKFAPNVDEETGEETPKAVDELRVKLACTPEGDNRVNLVFKYVAVKFTRFFFLKLRWTLYIPVPGPTVANIVIGISNFKKWLLRRKDQPERKRPKAFFDVLFLDQDLRVHKTGEDNLFIQARPEWKAAWETMPSTTGATA